MITYYGTSHELMNDWCIYEVYDADRQLIYIGHCELRNLFRLEDLTGHADLKPQQPIKIKLLETYSTESEALSALSEIMKRIELPPLNLSQSERNKRLIRCVESGEIFKTQAELCRLRNIKQSNLCRHIRREKGFDTVGGCRYEYC